ncbi:MAG: hypothetical protein PSN37_00480 [Alphaproteobacteria bacterium]|nr:hypothetical protein [Alphaproteobacteria bacterium]
MNKCQGGHEVLPWRSVAYGHRVFVFLSFIRITFFLSIVFFFVFAATDKVSARIRATVIGELFPRFGRMILSFDELPNYVKTLDDGVFVLEFVDSIEIDIDNLPVLLSPYVIAARLDPDGQAIRLGLRRKLNINLMEAGHQLFVDFLPEGWVGFPPGLPKDVIKGLMQSAEAIEAASKVKILREAGVIAVPSVRIEVGQAPTFTRLKFIWDRPVKPALMHNNENVTITFNQAGKLDLREVKAALPQRIKMIESEPTEDGLRVWLRVDASHSVRSFVQNNEFYVDVAGEMTAPSVSSALPLSPEGEFYGSMENKKPVFVRFLPLDPKLPLSAYADQDIVFFPKLAAAGPESRVRDKKIVPSSVPEETLMQGSDRKSLVLFGETEEPLFAGLEEIGQDIQLTFPFRENVPVAIFNRLNTVWIVFDWVQRVDLDPIMQELETKFDSVNVTYTGHLQIIRIKLRESALITAMEEGSVWVLHIGASILKPPKALFLKRDSGISEQPALLVALPGARHVHWLKDPDLGDSLVIIPAYGPPSGVIKPLNLVEFSVLNSAHGLVIQAIADDLQVVLRVDEVVMRRTGGLSLSRNFSRPGSFGDEKAAQIGLIEFSKEIDFEHFSSLKQTLEEQVLLATDEEKTNAKIALVRFHLKYGLAVEALGLLSYFVETDEQVTEDSSFRMLRGISNILAKRPSKAREDLMHPSLPLSPDLMLWRGMMEVEAGHWREAQVSIRKGEAALPDYSEQMQTLFRLAAIRSALELKDLADTGRHLDMLPPVVDDPAMSAEVLLVNGRYYDGLGRFPEALDFYDRSIKTKILPIVAEATLYRFDLQNKADSNVPRNEIIESLERFLLSWRGDDFELKGIDFLVDLHVAGKNYSRAFELMRAALDTQPKSRISQRIREKMSVVFLNLFLDGVADEMSALDALSLYYDYRELTPFGRQGDEMIRKLTDRLVEVNLLGLAIELLTHQVDNRLRGVARAQVSVRLSFLYLLNREPGKVLSVLQRTGMAVLPLSLQKQRNLLKVRALAESGRIDMAFALLEAMSGSDVERLRADVLWKGNRWQEVAEVVERYLSDSWSKEAALTDMERYEVMRAAIGYSLAKDHLGLDRLHSRFTEKMSQSVDARAFEVLTQPIRKQGKEFLEYAKRVASIDTLESFLEEFGKKISSSMP